MQKQTFVTRNQASDVSSASYADHSNLEVRMTPKNAVKEYLVRFDIKSLKSALK